MTISAADVRHIARLARLDLSEDEVERFRGELAKILDHVGRLEELESGGAPEPEAPDQPLRVDVVEEWPDVAPLRAEAPDFTDGFFRVPRVIE
ncbi:MAG: Asp-tRNA(Asn)/Glu-tRNA(Gln) amidotransferase subunit GatC [Gemmatimonadota bacterium]|nr:Asp-tRNA(Asn)/Glu-tRNA(Gln) amidotransferase subunit GatC [Gemmatimonadota bacterium]